MTEPALPAPAPLESVTLTSLREVAGWLFAQGVALVQEPDGTSLTVPVDDTALMIVWPEDDEVLQLVQPYDLDVPQDAVAAVESACVRLNHGQSLPGFGFNHDTQVPYYRLALWAPDLRLESGQLDAMLDVLIRTGPDYRKPFERVLEGGAFSGQVPSVR